MIVESGIGTKLLSRAATAAFAFAAFAVAACSDDKTEYAPVPDESTTTTAGRVDPAAYVESGDYVNGRHAAYVTAFDQAAATFDVVQFLLGDEAKQAYEDETGDTDGPPNDFYIRNQNKQLRTLPVAEDVAIRVNNAGGYEPSDPDKGHVVNRSTFESYVKAGTAGGLFWLTIEDATVIAIEEQYLP